MSKSSAASADLESLRAEMRQILPVYSTRKRCPEFVKLREQNRDAVQKALRLRQRPTRVS